MTGIEQFGSVLLASSVCVYLFLSGIHWAATGKFRWFHLPAGTVLAGGACFILYCIGSYLRYLWGMFE